MEGGIVGGAHPRVPHPREALLHQRLQVEHALDPADEALELARGVVVLRLRHHDAGGHEHQGHLLHALDRHPARARRDDGDQVFEVLDAVDPGEDGRFADVRRLAARRHVLLARERFEDRALDRGHRALAVGEEAADHVVGEGPVAVAARPRLLVRDLRDRVAHDLGRLRVADGEDHELHALAHEDAEEGLRFAAALAARGVRPVALEKDAVTGLEGHQVPVEVDARFDGDVRNLDAEEQGDGGAEDEDAEDPLARDRLKARAEGHRRTASPGWTVELASREP